MGSMKMSRTLPRRDREVRVERSSHIHLREVRAMLLRDRTSETRENMLVRMGSGRSWM